MIQSDKDTCFMNLLVQNFLKKYPIEFFTTFSEQKASIAEHFNYTIKGIRFKLHTKSNNRRYIHQLNDIANRYNNSYHRSIKMKPIEINKESKPLVWIDLYEHNNLQGHNEINFLLVIFVDKH